MKSRQAATEVRLVIHGEKAPTGASETGSSSSSSSPWWWTWSPRWPSSSSSDTPRDRDHELRGLDLLGHDAAPDRFLTAAQSDRRRSPRARHVSRHRDLRRGDIGRLLRGVLPCARRASPAPNNQGRAPAKGSAAGRRDAGPRRASHAAIDQGRSSSVRLRPPEREVAGAAEGLAGRRVVAAGEDLGQALGAVLSHPRNIGRKRPAPEGFWTPVQLIDHERERPGVPSRRANSLLCDPKQGVRLSLLRPCSARNPSMGPGEVARFLLPASPSF